MCEHRNKLRCADFSGLAAIAEIDSPFAKVLLLMAPCAHDRTSRCAIDRNLPKRHSGHIEGLHAPVEIGREVTKNYAIQILCVEVGEAIVPKAGRNPWAVGNPENKASPLVVRHPDESSRVLDKRITEAECLFELERLTLALTHMAALVKINHRDF